MFTSAFAAERFSGDAMASIFTHDDNLTASILWHSAFFNLPALTCVHDY